MSWHIDLPPNMCIWLDPCMFTY
ncbi:hypothetical protein OIU74_002160 [Salix koriyanagi]|uniref:Uncharacterized protein n=1 Tax=Salix koriyanagi TaxID=2511006 RepID=A0A9Q0X3P0_9ROSI|nr:hypothetical protein OIU74_002160 [Salix koriyanagi]